MLCVLCTSCAVRAVHLAGPVSWPCGCLPAPQTLRFGASYNPPRQMPGVIVTDANAAPGMLVQRAFVTGALPLCTARNSTQHTT